MKKTIYAFLILSITFSGCEGTQMILKSNGESGAWTGLSGSEIAGGLREALEVGDKNSSGQLSALDGFFKNAAIKILLPEEAQKVEKALRDIGMGSLVD